MPRLKEIVDHVYSSAPGPLSDFARFAREGLEDKDYGFVEANGGEAARQLLRFASGLPMTAQCSVEQFILGYEPRINTAQPGPVVEWHKLLATAFEIARWEIGGMPTFET